jgi:hypothetical protein
MEFLGQLRDYELIKKDSALWSSLQVWEKLSHEFAFSSSCWKSTQYLIEFVIFETTWAHKIIFLEN